MAASQPSVRRRRPRRGSLARPVNGRLYWTSALVVLIPLVLLSVTVAAPTPLAKPILPGAFDTSSALALARDLSTGYPNRPPGSAGAIGAVSWFSDQLPMGVYGLRTSVSTWNQNVPGLGRVRLKNIAVLVPSKSPETVVVMAHRDDTGAGPGANDNASGTATLIELARAYAQPLAGGSVPVTSARRIVFLSTDGGAFGGLGAEHFLQTSPLRNDIVAVVNLDAIAGRGRPALEIGGDTPRSPNASLVATAVARIAEQAGAPPDHVGFLGQLLDLAFPFTLYEQGPFVSRGIPAVTITTGGDRPPPAFGDNAARIDTQRLGELGAASEQLLGSLDAGIELAPSSRNYIWVGGRFIRGWAIELILVALLVPYAVAVVDLYARCRRQRISLRAAGGALRSRLLFWLFAGLAFTCFRLLGAWPAGPARPPDPGTAVSDNWPVAALTIFAAVLLLGWAVARRRLTVRRPVTAEEEVAGYTVALLCLLVVGLLIVATNPFALLFAVPALNIWLWLPQIRIARAPVRLGLFALGLAGPALLVGSLAWRYGLGLDAPWYLFELVGIGYISPAGFAIVLAGAAGACQLAAAAAGRYAPYPDASERGPRGPFREAVRTIVLAGRSRRRPPHAASLPPASTG
ncbi:MAG TPA: M28 family peptidase [Gaiellaceae bacterium]|jgi:hypothetical protein|nr:M28 family peptidase [Gaiellaceae bacterium]